MSVADRSDLLARHLVDFFASRASVSTPLLEQLLKLLARQTIDGHVALELADAAAELKTTTDDLRNALDASGLAGNDGEYVPLMLDTSNRVYFRRYWQHECDVAQQLIGYAGPVDPQPELDRVAELLGPLFTGENEARQKTAAAVAALRRLAVVSGGPGTGKTTAVVRILALLLELDPDLRIGLAAPTGKAAARVSEAVSRASAAIEMSDAARSRIPETAATVHRLLGLRPGYCRYHRDNPLPHDVVVVDEASMIGVSLMARLLDALRPEARLILLGDQDQLASVEPGSVLGDICSAGHGRSSQLAKDLGRLGVDTPVIADSQHRLQDNVIRLTHSFRFDAGSGIGRLAAAVRNGETDAALAILHDDQTPEVTLTEVDEGSLQDAVASDMVAAFQPYLEKVATGDVDGALQAFDQFRLLCAFRKGPAGVRGLNALAGRMLGEAGLIDDGDTWFPGRPVIVTVNDYGQQLFNGDIGIAVPMGDELGLQVAFPGPDELRYFHAPRLPDCETVFAMTVHKSQGSEFDDVSLVLPFDDSELLGRALLYTAITRARQRVRIFGSRDILAAAIRRRHTGVSGLADRLRVAPVAKPPPEPSGPEQGSLF